MGCLSYFGGDSLFVISEAFLLDRRRSILSNGKTKPKKLKNFQKGLDSQLSIGYNDKLSNDGYISLICKSKWVGLLHPFRKISDENRYCVFAFSFLQTCTICSPFRFGIMKKE